MALHPKARRGAVALVVGVVLLAGVGAAGEYHLDDDVYRYDAARVTYDDGRLTVTDVETGERLDDVDPAPAVACERTAFSRRCLLERHLRRSNGSVASPLSPDSAYDYVRLDRYYRVATADAGEGWELALEPVSAAEAYDDAAYPLDSADPAVRRAVASGSVVTYHRVPPAQRFVRADGAYYTVYLTGFRDFGPPAAWTDADCVRRDRGDFCAAAARHRVRSSLPTVLAFAAGVLALGYAAAARRDRDGEG